MILRFEPLAAGSSTFSFVSGQGGEKQPIDVVSPTTPYWNFIRVRLNWRAGWTLPRALT